MPVTGIEEIKYSARTKTQEENMMSDDTNRIPQVGPQQGNPTADSDRVKAPMVDAGLMDFEGDQSRFTYPIIETGMVNPFGRTILTRRSPLKENMFSRSYSVSSLESKLELPAESNIISDKSYYNEWKKEIEKRNDLENTLNALQRHIVELEQRVTELSAAKLATINPIYKTDEEDLERETNWMLKKRRPTKKRKAEASPEIPTSNNFDILEVDDVSPKVASKNIKNKSKITPPAPVPRKTEPPPPIIVKGIQEFNKLKSLTQHPESNECKFTSYNNNVWKINTTSSDSYRLVTGELNKNEVQWHTYENKIVRPTKVMVRGLHPSCDEKEIVEYLAEKGFKITDAKNILKKESETNDQGERIITKRNLPLFMLTFDSEEKLDNIYSIKSILGIIVKLEPIRKNAYTLIQCKRCQAFGHTKTYCHSNPACVKCAGKHLTQDCTLTSEQKPKCVNCKEDHPASYRGCIIAVEQRKRKITLLKAQKQNKTNNNTKDKTRLITNQNRQSTTKQGQTDVTKTYSQIVKNARQQEDTSVSNMLNIILQRLNEQDKAIKLLTDQFARENKNFGPVKRV